jgi:dihydrofolate reductase
MLEPSDRQTDLGRRPRPYRVEGYAIISSDGMIADANGGFPDSLMIEADKEFFARELDRADVIVQGRNSYEHQANSPSRRRLVLTRKIAGLAPNPDTPKSFLWNPAGASVEQACAALGLASGLIGVIGGTDVFDLFLEIGYDAFHLSRADKAILPGGRPVFSQVRSGRTPEDVLTEYGFEPGPTQLLDDRHEASLVCWTRKPST